MAPVLQLRVALTVEDYERIVSIYQDGLGLTPAADWTAGESKAILFEMGSGTLEIFNEAQAAKVDHLEVGARVSGAIRLAIQVPDVDAAVARLVASGATLIHAPIVTPWNDRNARVQTPDGMQITLFQAG